MGTLYHTKNGPKGRPTQPTNIDILIHNRRQEPRVDVIETEGGDRESAHLLILTKVNTATDRTRIERRIPKTLL